MNLHRSDSFLAARRYTIHLCVEGSPGALRSWGRYWLELPTNRRFLSTDLEARGSDRVLGRDSTCEVLRERRLDCCSGVLASELRGRLERYRGERRLARCPAVVLRLYGTTRAEVPSSGWS